MQPGLALSDVEYDGLLSGRFGETPSFEESATASEYLVPANHGTIIGGDRATLRWSQFAGAGMASGASQSNGSYVNQFDESTPLGSLLSEGIVEQVDGGVAVQTVGYWVSLHARNLLFYDEPDDLTNNAFVVHADGQADWYNAIRGSGSVALRFDFFELGSGFSTPEAVALSLTSPHRQPDLVDALAAEVKRLHFNEVYDVDVIGALALPTRTCPARP